MRRIRILCVLLSLIGTTGLHAAWSQHGTVITTDGTTYTGLVQSRTGQIEWRQDIYEVVNENGEKELFILEPSMRGQISLADIKEIRLLPPNTGPTHYATLSDNTKAKLFLKYVIIKKDGTKLYISDFITLNSYALDLTDDHSTKQIYITRISRLWFHQRPVGDKLAPQEEKTSTPKKVDKIPMEQEMTSMEHRIAAGEATTDGAPPVFHNKQGDSSSLSFAFIILSAVFFILFLVILIILLAQLSKKTRYKNLTGKKKKRRN
jgi:hypothetical protein